MSELKIILEEQEVLRATKEKVSVQIIVCSDGKRFDISKEAQALAYQKGIDEFEEFKKAIKYTLIPDLDLCRTRLEGHRKTFTFEWDENMPDAQKQIMLHITDMVPITGLASGKYLVIEYWQYFDNHNGADWKETSGFFGTIPDYIAMLETEVNKAKNIL